MISFVRDELEMFLGVVRKYMQIRGSLAQKDLAEGINVGISTISRFLNSKTKDIDAQLVAKIVAYLQVPLYEMIDFVSEESTENFKKLVAFHKEALSGGAGGDEEEVNSATESIRLDKTDPKAQAKGPGVVTASFGKKGRTMAFMPDPETQDNMASSSDQDQSIRSKLNRLSPRQKAYLSDFLELDGEARDLIVDVGNQLFRYFKQKRIDF